MIAAIYARVSTDQQAEKGYGLDTQLLNCRQKAKEINASQIEEFVDDGYSGAYLERPALDRLRQGLREKRFKWVVVYDPDRLARNLTLQLILTDEVEHSGAQLIFVNFEWENTPEGKLFYSMRGAISAYEREKTRQRTMGGKRSKALSGKVVRNSRPYGYDWDEANSIYIVNEEEAKMIRQIFSWAIEDRLGIRAISRKLAEGNYPTRTNISSWSWSVVYDILTRETYAGTHWVNKYYKTKVGQNKSVRGTRDPGEWIAVSIPPIVSREVWEAAQRQLQLNKRITKKPILYNYLCRNLMVCSLCGEKMRATVSGTKSKPYYVCKTGRAISGKSPIGESAKCPARQIPADTLDQQVWQYISSLLRDPEMLNSVFEESLSDESGLSTIRETLVRLQSKEEQLVKEREKVTLLFRQDLIDLTLAEKQLGEIKSSLATVQAERRQLEFELNSYNQESSATSLLDKFNELQSSCDTDCPEDRRDTILKLVRGIHAQRIDDSKGVKSNPKIQVNIDFRI